MQHFTVRCNWDEEARVWYVEESDIIGLSTGAGTMDELVQRLHQTIPELLELNDQLPEGPDIYFVVHAEHHVRVAA